MYSLNILLFEYIVLMGTIHILTCMLVYLFKEKKYF